MAKPVPRVEQELEHRIAELGFELVTTEWAGNARRPIIRLRVDIPGSALGEGITVDQCVGVSRALERWLDELEEMPEKYVLEVSSPGVERPIVREADWDRFAGHPVAVKGRSVLAGKATYLEGEIVGLKDGEGEAQRVCLRLPGGEEVEIPTEEISGAHLVFKWK